MGSLRTRHLLTSVIACALVAACAGHDGKTATDPGSPNPDGTNGSDPTPVYPVYGDGDPGRAGLPPGSSAGGSTGSSDPLTHVFVAPTYTTLFAVSDVHGHLAQLSTLLVKGGLVSATSVLPSNVTWTGGNATLVITGDMIDKGPASLEVIASAMALQAAAKNAGGTVVVLLGNHEAEFLGTPTSSKFTGSDTIDDELGKLKPAISPVSFASGMDPRGAWLRTLPVAARVDGWFFSHAGQSAGQTLAQIDSGLASALASSAGYTSPAFIGADSVLESRDWYTSGVDVVNTNLKGLGATHIAFGHDPNAFGVKGIVYAPPAFYGKLVRLDAGLGAGDSNGELLRVRHDGTDEVAESILPNGTVHPLFRSPH